MKTIKDSFTGLTRKLLVTAVSALLLAPLFGYSQTDNTAALQTQLTAGNVTLTAGATYYVTGVNVTHTLNMNGATIVMTGASNAAIKLTAAGAVVTNGTVKGSWNATMAYNASGAMGVRILADNCTVSNVHITGVPAYGILCQAYNKPVITGNTLDNIGYIGIYYDSEANTTGGTCSNNTVDRSMIAPASVHQPGIAIRGSTASTFLTTGWTISNNVMKMPSMPTDWTAEGMEVRNVSSSTVSNNTATGGSIPISIVKSASITSSGNKLSAAQLEGLEFADCTNSSSTNDVITGSSQVGILLDGSVGNNTIALTNDQVSGTLQECIHTYTNTQNVTITGCTLNASASGTKAINLKATNYVKIVNTTFLGNNSAGMAVMLDTCPGNLTISGGSIANFTSCVVNIYNATAGLVTNNVSMSGVTVTNVPKALVSNVANGGTVGASIAVVNH